MIEKIIHVKGVSKLGTPFEYTKVSMVLTEEEKRERYEKRLDEARKERRREYLAGQYDGWKAMHPTTLSDIMASVEEYIENVRDFDY